MEVSHWQGLANKLNIATSQYENQVRTLMEKKILGPLKIQSQYSIDRCSLVGGLAKKTSTPIKADADIVVFYNNKFVDKESVIQDFKRVLMANNSSGIRKIQITKNHNLKFVLDDIHFDLLIAENNATGNSRDVVAEQRINSYRKIKQAGNYSKSFGELGVQVTESSVAFMKDQKDLIRDVARLAKFWNQNQSFEKYIYGQSTIMELLATKAGLEEINNSNNPSVRNAFKRFLVILRNISDAYVVFFNYYNKSDVPTEVLRQRPLLLDPTNPYNNLLGGECGYGYCKFDYVPENLKKFESFMSIAAKNSLDLFEKGCTSIVKIFNIPSSFLYQVAHKESWLRPKNYLVGVHSNSDPDIQHLDAYSEKTPNYALVSYRGDNFKKGVETLVKPYSGSSMNNSTATQVRDEVTTFIDKRDGVDRTWVTSDKKHSDKEVTMKVPMEGTDKSVVISFDIDFSSLEL